MIGNRSVRHAVGLVGILFGMYAAGSYAQVRCGSTACPTGSFCSSIQPGQCIPNGRIDCGSTSCDPGDLCVGAGKCVRTPPAPQSASATRFTIFFRSGDDAVLPQGALLLQEAARVWRSRGMPRMRVEGHSDNTDSPPRNHSLAESRAASVARYLSTLGIPQEGVAITGVVDSENNGQYPNRRATVILQ
jgi:outer membrane protein OmpA-like peptidoglycan-associated protein